MALVVSAGGQQEVVAPFVEQRLLGDGAGRDDAYHFAFHRSPGGGRVADLLADGHRFPELHQFRQVLVHRVDRHTGHRDGLAGRLAAGGQGDVEQFRGASGVVVEQLVEIPHPVEEQDVGVFRLDAQVLLHHRRVGGGASLRVRACHGA